MHYDLIVIGSGPGGYVAAIRAAQLNMKVAVVERESLGGICLNWGCIPTKALLKSAEVYEYMKKAKEYGFQVQDIKPDFSAIIQRSRKVAEKMSRGIQFLFRKNKIETLWGTGKVLPGKQVAVTDKDGNTQVYSANHILIATGARSRELPGIKIDNERIIGYRKALVLEQLPKKMVIMGAGAIGVEFAYFYHTLGTEVTIVEYMERLVPKEDEEISKELQKAFSRKGIKFHVSSKVTQVEYLPQGVKVFIETPKGEVVEEADILLSAVGITPNTENLGLEEVGIETDRGWIKVDEFYRTNVEGYYAIGDVIPGPALAHVASAEGIICVEKIAGLDPEPLDYNNVPSCTYCVPEIASVGLTEKAAREAGYEVKVGKFPFTASGKASAAGKNEGFVKLIFDAKYGELLGAHMIGDRVTDMIAELVVAKKLETTGYELIKSVHPHPTMSEAIMEAAAAAYDEVIHL